MKLILFLFRLLIFLWAIFCFHSCSKSVAKNPNNPANVTSTAAPDQKFLLEIRITESFDSFVYSDSVSMIVLVNKDNQVIVSEIKNFAPKTNTPSYTLGSCTANWIQDTIGEINVISVQGTIDGKYGDTSRNLFLNSTDSGATSPGFNKVCVGSAPETDPAIPMSGLATFSFFTILPGHKIYEEDIGDEFDRLTLLK